MFMWLDERIGVDFSCMVIFFDAIIVSLSLLLINFVPSYLSSWCLSFPVLNKMVIGKGDFCEMKSSQTLVEYIKNTYSNIMNGKMHTYVLLYITTPDPSYAEEYINVARFWHISQLHLFSSSYLLLYCFYF